LSALLIPKGHKIGYLGDTLLQRIFLCGSSIKLGEVCEFDKTIFWENLRSKLVGDQSSVVLFIHGFRTTFEDAAIRAAQLQVDLNVSGVMAFYSWPSVGTVRGYVTDMERVRRSVPFLIEFLKGLVAESGASRVHVIAHSMGNVGLLEALKEIDRRRGGDCHLFTHVVLAAADISRGDLEQFSELYQKLSKKTTAYTCRNDYALWFSSRIRDGEARVGNSSPPIVIPGIDAIDVTNVNPSLPLLSLLGLYSHSAFAESRLVLKDIQLAMLCDVPPGRRSDLNEVAGPPTYWELAR
jgi:esterase/lipase superfamily enzyme